MVDVVIFSYNRAMQLDCLLSGLVDLGGRIHVLYKATDDNYRIGYDICKERHKRYTNIFVEQTDFQKDCISIYSKLESDYVLTLPDDSIVINAIDLYSIPSIIKDECIALSLRLNPSCDYCQPAGKKMIQPNFTKVNGIYYWEWRKSNPFTCWGYPHNYDNVFKREHISGLVRSLSYNTPGQLEDAMNHNRPRHRYMACYQHSSIICNALNVANNSQSKNPSGNYSTVTLNEMYLSGRLIDYKAWYGYKTNAAHVILDPRFT